MKIKRFWHGKFDGYYLDECYPGGMIFDSAAYAEKVCFYLNDEKIHSLRYEVEK